jgi:hypothetical protein
MTKTTQEELLYQLHIIEALVRHSAEYMHDRSKWEKCTEMHEAALNRLRNLIETVKQ